MKKLFLSSFLFFAVFFAFVGCEKNKVSPDLSDHDIPLENKDETLISMAKITAKAQNNNEFRQILLAAAKQRYGNENSVFYFDIKDDLLTNHGTVEDFLAETATEMGINPNLTDFNELVQNGLAKLTFTIYDGTANNNLATFDYNSPIVVVPETKDFRSIGAKTVEAYGPSSEVVDISNTDEPEFATLVIENNASFVLVDQNTFITAEGQSLNELFGTDLNQEAMTSILNNIDHHKRLKIDQQDLILININQAIMYINSRAEADTRISTPSRACNRDGRNGREHMAGIKINENELKDFCKWYKSTCKVEVNTTFANNPNSTTMEAFATNLPKKYIVGQRSSMKNNKTYDISPDLSLYQWEYLEGNHSDRYSIDLVGKHHNPDGTTTFSIGFSPTVKFKIDSVALEFTVLNSTYSTTKAHNDTNLGGDLIHYCDGIDIIPCQSLYLCGKYSTGSTDFWITKYNN